LGSNSAAKCNLYTILFIIFALIDDAGRELIVMRDAFYVIDELFRASFIYGNCDATR